MGKSNELTDAEWLAYSGEHLLYELTTMVLSAELLKYSIDTPSGPMQPPYWNAAVESFAIHVRNLVDFLYPTSSRQTDVVADLFFARRKRPAGFPQITKPLEVARKRAHKELSHLTTERLSEGHPEKGWNTAELLQELFRILAFFSQHASPNKLHPEVGRFIATMAKERGISVGAQ